jgi:pimeloyl-ACP methyl ester carboxylesterase
VRQRIYAFLLTVFVGVLAAASGVAAPAGQLYVVSPFLLGASDLSNLDLTQLIPTIPSWSAVGALGLELDNTSAAIVLWQTTTPADVTFTTDDNASLVPYANNFLTAPPVAGATSLTVPAAAFLGIGGSFYAAALLEAPAPSVPVAVTVPITVAAAVGGVQQAAVNLSPIAPPVVLVHGMWGDATSLADLHNYLDQTPPWKYHPELVQAIAYTNYLGFEEPEPASVLNNQILTLFGTLDQEHVAGGRVDVVAHSMGGLVARHYSALGPYRGLRDRGQGKFHEIVTLDTPEAGSELAQYLLQHRHDTLQSFAPPQAMAIWLAACGSPQPTVGQCFRTLGMRLGPRNLERGAVWSLVPGSIALAQLPAPDIADAVWQAVTAIVPQRHSIIGESALEFELQQLIAATWPDPNTRPPTIATILADHRQDDAIVPLSSQMAGAATGQYVTFPNLAHSPAADASILGLVLSNANVLQASEVSSQAACWLAAAAGVAPCNSQAPVIAAAAADTGQPPFDIGKLHYARRIQVQQPHDLRLATPFALAIRVTAPGLVRLVLRQQDELGHRAEPQVLTIDKRLGDTVYANATPDLYGTVRFTVDALFRDGGLSSQTVTAPVHLPDTAPIWFHADANAQHIRIGLGAGLNIWELHPQALYSGSAQPVALDGRAVDYRIVSGDGIVALSKNPENAAQIEIVGLAPGTARIEARLGTAAAADLDVTVERQ